MTSTPEAAYKVDLISVNNQPPHSCEVSRATVYVSSTAHNKCENTRLMPTASTFVLMAYIIYCIMTTLEKDVLENVHVIFISVIVNVQTLPEFEMETDTN